MTRKVKNGVGMLAAAELQGIGDTKYIPIGQEQNQLL